MFEQKVYNVEGLSSESQKSNLRVERRADTWFSLLCSKYNLTVQYETRGESQANGKDKWMDTIGFMPWSIMSK